MAQDRPTTVSLYKQADQISLSLQCSFHFHCHDGLSCFNRCCRTPTIILSPYDILRLKHCLGINSGEFLKRYTRQETEERSNLPLVFLDPYRSPGGGCPFLGAKGCTVYAHRPAACRLFPITMGSQLTAAGIVDYYFCRKLDYCQGFDTNVEWTVGSWKTNQGFDEYEEGRREWLEILLRKGLQGPLEVDPQIRDLFATLAYDLDTLRHLIGEPAFLKAYDLSGKEWEYLNQSDLALLKFSYRLLPSVLLPNGAGLMHAVMRGSGKADEMD